MINSRVLRSTRVSSAVARRAVAMAILTSVVAGTPGSAQRLRFRSHAERPTLLLEGGGSYDMSDLEIAPGPDQTGGWAWNAGLRLQHGRGSLGVGFERTRFDVGPDGSGTTLGIYIEPRLAWGFGRSGVRPYLFAHGARVFDYDISEVCCSVYGANSNGTGWLLGGGFGVTTAPIGYVRFDLSAGVSRLSGEADAKTPADGGAWKSAGPLVGVRLGASVPLTGVR